MHAPYEKPRNSYRTEPKSGAGFFILPMALVFVVIVLVVFHPKASVWISQAAQAEFGGGIDPGETPTETVQPNMAAPMRTVHAN